MRIDTSTHESKKVAKKPVGSLPAEPRRTLASLRAEGKKMLAEGKHYDDIAATLGIYTPAGCVNPGLAYRIIVEGYEPKKLETQLRLGIEPVCSRCGRHMKRRHRRKKSLFDFSKKDLLKMFNEREDM